MDIFDEEDLLAIANDGGSSPSNDDASSEASSAPADDAPDKTDVKEIDIELDDQNTHAQKKVQLAADDDESSDDEDGGFLESWLSDLKKQENDFEEKMIEAHERNSCIPESKSSADHLRENDDLEILNSDTNEVNEVRASVDRSTDAAKGESVVASSILYGETVQSKDCLEVHLGSSVIAWISKYNSKRRKTNTDDMNVELNDNAFIGIQQESGMDEVMPSSLLMELKSVASSHNGNNNSMKPVHRNAIIVASDVERKQYKGDAVAYTCKAKKEHTMVDCVARYDQEKKCYILEMVGMSVSNLQPYSGEAEQKSDGSKSRANIDNAPLLQHDQKIADPRLLAKRAEAQVKKLKQAKRNSVGNDGKISKSKGQER